MTSHLTVTDSTLFQLLPDYFFQAAIHDFGCSPSVFSPMQQISHVNSLRNNPSVRLKLSYFILSYKGVC
jgi:hypothetical protein